MGHNVSVSNTVLQSIKPSLRKSNETLQQEAEDAIAKSGKKANKNKSKTVPATEKSNDEPNPTKKEDVVFDVTANNFQKIVLESPVPVLVDVYADWCGPCKQLGPVLEQAAIASRGMFRLAKVNSDKEQSLASNMGVKGLPTVFTVVNGKFNDRYYTNIFLCVTLYPVKEGIDYFNEITLLNFMFMCVFVVNEQIYYCYV